MYEKCRILVEVPVGVANDVEIYLRTLTSISYMSCNRSMDDLAVSILEHYDIPAKDYSSGKVSKRDRIFYYVEHGNCTMSHMVADELSECTLNFVYNIPDFFRKYIRTTNVQQKRQSISSFENDDPVGDTSVNSILANMVKREEQNLANVLTDGQGTSGTDTPLVEPDSSLYYDLQRSATVYVNETLNECDKFEFDANSPQGTSGGNPKKRRLKDGAQPHQLKKGYTMCRMCSLVLKGTNLYDHAKSHYGKTRFTCLSPGCNYGSPFRSCINRHVQKLHNNFEGGGYKDNWSKDDFTDYTKFADSLTITHNSLM